MQRRVDAMALVIPLAIFYNCGNVRTCTYKLTKINIVHIQCIHVLIVIFKGIEVFVLCVGISVSYSRQLALLQAI